MVQIWRVKIGPNYSTDDVVAKSIEEAIAKVRKRNEELLNDDHELYIDSAELLAYNDY